MALSIRDHQIPDYSLDYYDVILDTDEILTLVTYSPDAVDDWISEIFHIHHRRLHRLIIGLDIQWRPNFNRHYRNAVATLQLCVGHRCLIYQIINAAEIPQSLIHFLRTYESLTFVGVGIDNDVQKLYEDYDLEVSNTIDLRVLAEEEMGRSDLRNAGLKSLAREVLGKEINQPRNITLSRWDNERLSLHQVAYGCIDAFLSFKIGRVLI